MRVSLYEQPALVAPPVQHPRAKELEMMSDALDALGREPVDLVYADLCAGLRNPKRGRKGLSAEQTLRVGLLKQMTGLSYEELAFHLADSSTYRRFCRFGLGEKPKKKALNCAVKRVRPETFEAVNDLLIQNAIECGVEDAQTVRTDCTVEETNIHDPSDSALLWDCVRVLSRLLRDASKLVPVSFTDHSKRAKRRHVQIQYAGSNEKRKAPYRELLKLTRKTLNCVPPAIAALEELDGDPIAALKAEALVAELKHYRDLSEKVVDQTERRVVIGEKVPAEDKIVSIFEPHTDIIVKKRREVQYGHKLCVTTGRSGLVLDCRVLEGNPTDSKLAVAAIDRVSKKVGRSPENAAFDGCFASGDNLHRLKTELNVRNVAFKKKRGLEVQDMTENAVVYRSLTNFRAGIEAGLSFLKRCFGLGRCTWKGWTSFRAYTWASVLSANLLMVARHQLG